MKKKASVAPKASVATPDIQEQVRVLGGSLGLSRKVPTYATISDAISLELTKLLSTLLPLHSLSMYNLGKKVSAKVFAPLAALKGIKDLSFQECTLNSAQLEFCSQLELLERIVMDSCSVDDAALANFSKSTKCKMLLLRESGPFTGEGLGYLKGWEKLETLKLTESKVTDAVFPALAGHKRLQEIRLNNNPLTGRGLKELVSLPEIDFLDLSKTKLSDQNLRAAVGLSAKSLSVSGCPLHGESLESLWTWKRLKSLNVWGTEVDDYGLEQIAKCDGLTDLSLGFCPVTEKGLISLTKLKLQSLNLSGVTAVNDDVLTALAGMKSLKSLTLINVNVSDKGMLALSESKLKELVITASTDTVGGLIYFVGNKTIEHIDIDEVREAHEKEIKKRQAAIRAAQKKASVKHQFFIG